MNRSFAIIGVPAVVLASAYAAALWGRWAAAPVAVGLAAVLWMVAVVERRRRRAGREAPLGR
jgi:hypothetical protein